MRFDTDSPLEKKIVTPLNRIRVRTADVHFQAHLTVNARSHISPPLNRFIFSQFSAIMSFSNISAISILSRQSHKDYFFGWTTWWISTWITKFFKTFKSMFWIYKFRTSTLLVSFVIVLQCQFFYGWQGEQKILHNIKMILSMLRYHQYNNWTVNKTSFE